MNKYLRIALKETLNRDSKDFVTHIIKHLLSNFAHLQHQKFLNLGQNCKKKNSLELPATKGRLDNALFASRQAPPPAYSIGLKFLASKKGKLL